MMPKKLENDVRRKPASRTHPTPGPWNIIDRPVSGAIQIVPSGTGLRIATVTNCDNENDNARLIAAAPDLLAACKALLTHLLDPKGDREIREMAIDDARAAIAKAQGGAE